MPLAKELFYREYIQRENDLLRAPYNPELEFYTAIQSGNIRKVQHLCQEPLSEKSGLGTLSQTPLQNIKFHFVITTALIARYCIEGGMELSVAYNLSDFYILKADSCNSIQEISALHPAMCLDYTKRMKALRKQKITSKPIAECIDYIYDHLHTRITIDALAEHVNLSNSYLSRLFKKETGLSVSKYISTKKIETAQNMLIYSDYSLAEISSTLAFPTQSYFTETFRKQTGFTPSQYRRHNTRTNKLGKYYNES